jgi:SAM-dependent methyltransferase
VVGVDISAEALAWAEFYFHGPTYIRGNIEDEPWEGKFETVVSIETIEHLKDPSKALQAFRRACVGIFIASVPNEENYPFKAENFASDEWPHYRHYTPQEFEELLAKHDFTVKERFCQISKSKPWMRIGTDGLFLVYVCT